MKRPTLLCILDGFGLNPRKEGNAIALARTPNFSRIFSGCPAATLTTHSERVGLPQGQMGNSEVGHLNIGAGRVVEQWLLRISRGLSSGSLGELPAYQNFIRGLIPGRTLHLAGLFSDGGVHAHTEHFYLLLERLLRETKADIALHLFTDGRDTSPTRALTQVQELEKFCSAHPRCRIASMIGRFYAMDRDRRWERTAKAFQLITRAEGTRVASASEWLSASYEKKITDEFIEPAVISGDTIKPGEGVIFWNFREDRMRQIVRALAVQDFSEFARPTLPATQVLCFTEYDHSFHLPFLFPAQEIKNHLGEVLAAHGITQLRVAETEKYPHVTYFFNGGVETPWPGEDRALTPSPRDVKTYDEKPEMSAAAVCEIVTSALSKGAHDFIAVNFANCDMVGHTGVLAAAIKAVETVDACLGKILSALDAAGGQAVIIADHGNAEQMINYEDGTPHTAHTTFPVPVIVYGRKDIKSLSPDGALCDVAPTILELMNLPKPLEMSGHSLLQK